MDRLIDEIVQIKVSDAVAAATPTSVNTAAIIDIATKNQDKVSVQYSQKDIETFYGVSNISKESRSFFSEQNNPGRIVCIPTENIGTNLVEILDNALGQSKDENGRNIDFYHIIIRLDKETTAQSIINLVEGSSAQKGLEEWCNENFRLAHIEIQNRETAENVLDGLSKPTTRIAFYFHNEDKECSLAAAIVADRCANDPARGTWAHKTLSSLVADATTKSELIDAQEKGLNIYCKVAGVDRLFFGTVGSKIDFIDLVVKKDWLKFRTQEAIYNLLGSANNGDGVDYNDSGISAIAAAINSIFVVACDNDHRYIMPDSFEIQIPKYDDINSEDKAVRNLPNIKVPFSLQNSIHTVKNVELQVIA